MRYAVYIVLFFAPFFLFSCQKENHNEISSPSTDTTSMGTIYFQGGDSLYSADIAQSKLNWRAKYYKVFGSDGSFYTSLNYDSGYIYKSSVYETICFNANTGIWKWYYNFGIYYISGSAPTIPLTQKAVFSDSLMFFTQSYITEGISLYCLNKRNGHEIWKKKIFYNGGSISPYKPVIEGDRIFVAGSNSSGTQVLYCFNKWTGQKIWESSIGNSNPQLLEFYNGTIISWHFQKSFCFDAGTGSLLWQNSLPSIGGLLNSTDIFSDGSQALILRSWPSYAECFWINKLNGAVESSYNFPDNYSQCAYKDKEIVFVSAGSTDDSIRIANWNLQSFAKNWDKKILKVNAGGHPSNYFTPLVRAANQLIFAEEVQGSAIAPKKIRFDIIDFASGNIDKQISLDVKGLTQYFTIVKQENIYSTHH